MKCCPITFEPLGEGETFSRMGLRLLHPQLKNLSALPLSGDEQLREVKSRVDKMLTA